MDSLIICHIIGQLVSGSVMSKKLDYVAAHSMTIVIRIIDDGHRRLDNRSHCNIMLATLFMD
jgi:hypothetical protein